MFEAIYKGFLIGLCTSIPVGPIGILCIQRTLHKGRMHGFFSGLGAATSDFLYALVALLGLSFVMNFVRQHELAIQIGGSIVIMGFGIHIFFQNPSRQLKKSNNDKTTYHQDFISAFGLTITNPLMIFLFIGLFARFSFVNGSSSPASIVFGMLSVFLGSATWWFILTFVANLFKSKLNMRGLGFLNKIAGSLISVIAIIGLILSLTGNSISSNI